MSTYAYIQEFTAVIILSLLIMSAHKAKCHGDSISEVMCGLHPEWVGLADSSHTISPPRVGGVTS